MNGVVVHSQAPLGFAREADAVIVGSGVGTRELAHIGDHGGAALRPGAPGDRGAVLGGAGARKLGLLANVPACTDSKTRPWVEEGRGGGAQPAVRRAW